jgi:spore photoproduct lyase
VTISKLYIDQKVAEEPQTRLIQSRLSVPHEIVEGSHSIFQCVSSAKDPIGEGKEILLLTHNKGAFIKDCPGTRCYTCCGYKILHIGTYCTMDCAYCILQSYFHPPLLQYFINRTDMLRELDNLFAQKKIYRIGTGEFTDSLIWESWTGLARDLVTIFSQQDYVILELKTKTTSIEGLRTLRHNQKTIISWSLNTNKIISTEERRTASLSARLESARKCAAWGYPLGFHFDPMIIYDDCEKDYCALVQALFNHVPSEQMAWISLGTLRFPPSLKPIIQRRFPDSKIVYGEFITGLDNKVRYFKPLRIDLYRSIISVIKDIAPDVCIYLCMEDSEVWQKTLGYLPSAYGGLPKMLDERAATICGLVGDGLA